MTPQQQQQQQTEEEAPSPWRAYPAGHNAITTPPGKRSLSDRLSGLGEVLFCDEIDFRVVDIRSENGRLAPFSVLCREWRELYALITKLST